MKQNQYENSGPEEKEAARAEAEKKKPITRRKGEENERRVKGGKKERIQELEKTEGGGQSLQEVKVDRAELEIEIGDAQHLIDTSTGVALELAQEDMLQLQQLLKENKKTITAGGDIGGDLTETDDDMAIDLTGGDLTSKDPADPAKQLGFCEIGSRNTVDLLNKNNQQLKDNTAANATSSL